MVIGPGFQVMKGKRKPKNWYHIFFTDRSIYMTKSTPTNSDIRKNEFDLRMRVKNAYAPIEK